MTEPETPLEERTSGTTASSGWHPVNIGHLVMGVAFLGLLTVWVLAGAEVVHLGDAHWLLPLPWLVAGVVGLVATVLRSARRRPGKMSGWT